jgi:hypothetical protein
MHAPTLEYIETDFADIRETCAQYRHRTAKPRKQRRLRRLLALA